MIELKKVGLDAIYWAFGNKFSVEHAYNALKEIIHENDFIFSVYRLGPNYHSWLIEGDGWQPLSKADDVEQGIVLGIYSEKTAQILAKISANAQFSKLDCSKFTTIPSVEDYLYFKPDPSAVGGYRIVLIAWGYEAPPVQGCSGKIEGKLFVDKRVGVQLSFIRGGKKLPSVPFVIEKPSGSDLDFTTDSNGIFNLGLMLPGKSYTVRYVPTGKTFPLTIENTPKVYEFDVSQQVELVVALLRDEKPAVGETIRISYDSQSYELVSNSAGVATTSVCHIEGAECRVEAMNECQSTCLTLPSTKIVISTTTPVEEVPYTPVIKVMWNDGTPCVDHNICVVVGKSTMQFKSDEIGLVQLSPIDSEGFMTIVDGDNSDVSQNYRIDINQKEYIFTLERETTITVKVCDSHNRSLTQGEVTLSQDGVQRVFSIEGNGEFTFGSSLFKENTPITVNLQSGNRLFEPGSFVYTPQEDQYNLIVRDNTMPWWQFMLYMMMVLLMVILLLLALDCILNLLGYSSFIL